MISHLAPAVIIIACVAFLSAQEKKGELLILSNAVSLTRKDGLPSSPSPEDV